MRAEFQPGKYTITPWDYTSRCIVRFYWITPGFLSPAVNEHRGKPLPYFFQHHECRQVFHKEGRAGKRGGLLAVAYNGEQDEGDKQTQFLATAYKRPFYSRQKNACCRQRRRGVDGKITVSHASE